MNALDECSFPLCSMFWLIVNLLFLYGRVMFHPFCITINYGLTASKHHLLSASLSHLLLHERPEQYLWPLPLAPLSESALIAQLQLYPLNRSVPLILTLIHLPRLILLSQHEVIHLRPVIDLQSEISSLSDFFWGSDACWNTRWLLLNGIPSELNRRFLPTMLHSVWIDCTILLPFELKILPSPCKP